MSGVNITCNIGNQLGIGGGEMKFNVASKDTSSLATCIATDIVNEILESALDIATLGNTRGLDCDTIAFSVDDGVCRFATSEKENFGERGNNNESSSFSSYRDDVNEEYPDIKELIEGLSALHVPNQNAEEPMRLDMEMKRLLSEMMSPPYDMVNYETLLRKDGVGDQPVEETPPQEEEEANSAPSDECLVDAEKTKIVEKKTRVTDLVMNSKRVLSEYLMTEEYRKKQEEWEESNEEMIQVIELEHTKEETESTSEETKFVSEEVIVLDQETEDFTVILVDDHMDNIDLNSGTPKENSEEKSKAIEKLEGGGDDSKDGKAGSSRSSTADGNIAFVPDINSAKTKNKFQIFKKKKWNINFKFLGIGKKKQSVEKEKTSL